MSGILYININVTNLDRTIEFYELVGFKLMYRMNPEPSTMRDTARMYNEAPNEEVDVAFMRFGDDGKTTCLDLCQWRTRPTKGKTPEYTHHAGMCRLTVAVDDVDAVISKLEAAGYEPIGSHVRMSLWEGQPPASLVAFRDPDGVFIQVVHGLDRLVS